MGPTHAGILIFKNWWDLAPRSFNLLNYFFFKYIPTIIYIVVHSSSSSCVVYSICVSQYVMAKKPYIFYPYVFSDIVLLYYIAESPAIQDKVPQCLLHHRANTVHLCQPSFMVLVLHWKSIDDPKPLIYISLSFPVLILYLYNWIDEHERR